jgi:hypothetical protein
LSPIGFSDTTKPIVCETARLRKGSPDVKRRIVLITVVCSLMTACARPTPVEQLPAVEETMLTAGKRLGQALSPRELMALSGHGDRILAALRWQERDALGRAWVRFRVDRPVIVEVAAPVHSVPFWLEDQDFSPTEWTLTNADGAFRVFRQSFPEGWVGLGVPGLDRSPRAHYAIFVRSQTGGDPPRILELRPDRLRVARAEDGVSPYLDAHRPFDRLPHVLRGALLVQTSHDDRHATALIKGRPWKTGLPSGPKPDQVVISFGAEPAHALNWTWRTEPSVVNTVLRLAHAAHGREEPADPKAIRIVRGDSQLVISDGLLNDPIIRRHRVTVADLAPDTTYAYTVGDGGESGWTPWRTVRTGPDRPRSFRFVYMGDPQVGLEAWGRLLALAFRRHPDAAFLLIAGDLVDRGNERTNWDHFFFRASGVFDRWPVMPAVGNHEYLDKGPVLYRAHFALPTNGPNGIAPGLVYAFEYAGALFAVLDSTLAVSDARLAQLQADWLDATLAHSRARWKFVMFHHPVYVSHTSRDNPELRDAWMPIFDRHRVDLVFQGHDHAYLRTYPMRAGRRAGTGESGTVYVISVSGQKFSEQAARDYTAKGLTHTATYQLIDVSSDRLVYRAFDEQGRAVDAFEIQKSDASCREGLSWMSDIPCSPSEGRLGLKSQ